MASDQQRLRLPASVSFAVVAWASAIVCAMLAHGCSGGGDGKGNGRRQESPPAQTNEATVLTRALIKDNWAKILGHDALIYDFAEDGTFTRIHKSDFNAPPKSGTWKLLQDDHGRWHLLLSGQGAGDWLGEDSIVEYDAKADKLMVSGGNYVGRIPLVRWDASTQERWKAQRGQPKTSAPE